MDEQWMPLNALPVGGRAVVRAVRGRGPGRRRLRELGLVDGTTVEALGRSPSGDPVAYRFRGVVVALRGAQAADVLCSAQ